MKVDDNIDLLNINASSEDVSGHQNSKLEAFESVKNFESLRHFHFAVNCFGRESFSIQNFRKLFRISLLLGKDDDLIEIQGIKQFN